MEQDRQGIWRHHHNPIATGRRAPLEATPLPPCFALQLFTEVPFACFQKLLKRSPFSCRGPSGGNVDWSDGAGPLILAAHPLDFADQRMIIQAKILPPFRRFEDLPPEDVLQGASMLQRAEIDVYCTR